MKKAIMAISLAIAASAVTLPFTSQAAVKDEMGAMAKSYKSASGATDAATLKADLLNLKAHATKAKADPEFANSPNSKVFNEGLDKLLKQIDAAIALVDAGKLPEAKAATDELKKTRAEYHKKLGV
ncbi:cytochrome b562 [Dickeya chrysanthemi Ech1591]|uniref:Cytochrome b562 n=1 Tax=Dickeya chrysanthemi (strain Ech1591) TaxID=561229 RepID=C6CF35_DICC1|nr:MULTISPECIES: cytochrome b562 [Dickeya]ACT06385.1 cytochrome b562 [Dickeya chrysanthemi Ech1591]TYL43502.1 cytochrome b562 [Dickeya sp. ws52]WJM86079.1 cytochrome b562 [Dickeya chrysanthemi]